MLERVAKWIDLGKLADGQRRSTGAVAQDDGTVGFAGQTATVTMADIDASNGVIHVIDAVLLP